MSGIKNPDNFKHISPKKPQKKKKTAQLKWQNINSCLVKIIKIKRENSK